jgi:outer membrane protein
MRIVNVRRRSLAGAVVSLVALAPVAPALADGGPLSLVAVLERVRERNVSIRSAKTSVLAADAQVQKAWTAWQPNVQAVGQLQFNSVEAKFDSSQIVVGVAQSLGPAFGLTPETVAGIVANLQANAPEPTVIQPIVSLVGQLSAKQLLFNINAVRGPGVAEKGRAATLGVVQATEDELTFAAAQLFVSINGLRALEAAALRASQVADRRIQDAKAQLEAGTATRLAVTRAETDKATSEGQILALHAQQTGLLASLRGLMGATEEAVELVNAPLEQQLEIALPAAQETRSRVRR